MNWFLLQPRAARGRLVPRPGLTAALLLGICAAGIGFAQPTPRSAPPEQPVQRFTPAAAGAADEAQLNRARELLRREMDRQAVAAAPAPAADTARAAAPGSRKSRKYGPRFNARAPAALTLTNFSALPATNAIPSEWLLPPTAPFTLGPGDVLDIELMGVEGRTATLVCPDGKIYYHLLPGLTVWGLTLAETKALLERELFKFQRVPRPRVSLTIRSVGSKRVWLLGRVNAPGIFPLAVPMTLLETLTLAGGPVTAGDTELASLADSFVMRQGQLLPVNFQRLLRDGDMSQNIYVQPDDFIYLPSSYAQEIYVLGAVRQTGPVPFREEMTLMTALASAGGAGSGAALSHVAIVRGSLNDPRIAIVDFGAVQKGRATDVLLEPRDIVYVPRSPMTVLWRYLNVVLRTFVRTVAVNEGARAVVRDEEPVAPVVVTDPTPTAPGP